MYVTYTNPIQVDALEAAPEAGGGAARLVAGAVVEPRRGRLVLFSGGGENYHAPLPVTQGRRTSFQVWFGCDCDDDGVEQHVP